MSDEAAVLCGSVMANGYQWAILHGGVTFGDTVLIQGPGQQGLACTWAARAAGAARIIVSGVAADADRLVLARRWGADLTVEADRADVVAAVADETGGAMADVVVDVSGSPAALASSVAAVRKRGTLVLAGLSGGRKVPVEIDALVWNEIRVQGAFTASSPALRATMELIESTGFKPEEMISHTFGLDDTERCIRAIGNEVEGMYPHQSSDTAMRRLRRADRPASNVRPPGQRPGRDRVRPVASDSRSRSPDLCRRYARTRALEPNRRGCWKRPWPTPC